jgi:hypothetical protein
MKVIFDNPFPVSTDAFLIWEVLIRNDFEGFLQGSWERVADDYIEEGFFGVDFGKSTSPTDWTLGFPSLQHYMNQWLVDSNRFRENDFAADPRQKLYESCQLAEIQITGNSALVHKLFVGDIPIIGRAPLELNWRSLFLLRKQADKWRIAGFCGYINTPPSI